MSTKVELPPEAFELKEQEYFVVDLKESRLRFKMDALGDRGLSFLLAALAISERQEDGPIWVDGICAIKRQFTTTMP